MTTIAQDKKYPAKSQSRWYPETIGILDTPADDGRVIELHRFAMAPLKLAAPPRDLEEVALLAADYDLGQIWITPRCATGPMDLPAEIKLHEAPEAHPWARFELADAAIEPHHGGIARWYTVRWLDGSGRITIALPHLDQDAPWSSAASAEDMIAALRLFRAATGSEWHWSTSSTASGIASRAFPNLRKPKGEMPPAVECRAVSDGHLALAQGAGADGAYHSPIVTQWTRRFDEIEEFHEFIYGYDCNAAYLGSIGAAVLGRGEPEHWPHRTAVIEALGSPNAIKRMSSGRMPGYFRLAATPQLPRGVMLPGFRFRNLDARWVTAPILEFLLKQQIQVTVEEAWVWHDTVRPFEEFARILTAARSKLVGSEENSPEDIALSAVKDCYSTFYRWLGRGHRASERGLWRPDWSHAITDLAMVNHWRRVLRIAEHSKRWPVAMRNDELLYTSDDPNQREAAPVGMLLPDNRASGTFKPHGWCAAVTVREYQGEAGGKFWRAWEKQMIEGERG